MDRITAGRRRVPRRRRRRSGRREGGDVDGVYGLGAPGGRSAVERTSAASRRATEPGPAGSAPGPGPWTRSPHRPSTWSTSASGQSFSAGHILTAGSRPVAGDDHSCRSRRDQRSWSHGKYPVSFSAARRRRRASPACDRTAGTGPRRNATASAGRQGIVWRRRRAWGARRRRRRGRCGGHKVASTAREP